MREEAPNTSDSSTGDGSPARGVLRVVRGNPDDTELAVLTAALSAAVAAAGTGETESTPQRISRWGARADTLRWPGGRRPLRPGPDAWRASALPG